MHYGITVYQGMFGKGKTYYVFSQLYKAILQDRSNPYVIANIPYSFVDLFFSDVDSLQSIVTLISDYIRHMNNDVKEYKKYYDDQRPIIIIIDEAQLFFNSRDWGSGQLQAILKPLSQCRKRKIKFILITQNPITIDKGFRILCDYTVKMDTMSFLGFDFVKARTYYNPGDIIDLNTQVITLGLDSESFSNYADQYLESSQFFYSLSDIFSYFNAFQEWYHILKAEEHNTLYVTGLGDTNCDLPSFSCYYDRPDYMSWYSSLYPSLTSPPSISFPPPLPIKKFKKGVDTE